MIREIGSEFNIIYEINKKGIKVRPAFKRLILITFIPGVVEAIGFVLD